MNSRVALADAAKLVSKLIQRTQEGKIVWTINPKRRLLNALETSFEGDMKATVWTANSEIGFRVSKSALQENEAPASDEDVIESPETVLLSISLRNEYRRDYDFPEEFDVYRQLVELHELARRAAYKMDAQFENINDYLDRLAG